MRTCAKDTPAMMRNRVALQQVTQVSDGQGGFTEEWATIAIVWVKLEPLKGYEKFQASQLQTPISHSVLMRYRSGVTTKHRLLYNGRIFDIKEVINVQEAGTFLKLKVIEKA